MLDRDEGPGGEEEETSWGAAKLVGVLGAAAVTAFILAKSGGGAAKVGAIAAAVGGPAVLAGVAVAALAGLAGLMIAKKQRH